MSHTPRLLAALTLLGTLTSTPAAQDVSALQQAPQQAPRSFALPVFTSDEVGATLFRTRHADALSIYNAVRQLHGRRFQIQENGDQQNPPNNIQIVGDSILIFDHPDYTRRVLATCELLDVPGSNVGQAEDLELMEYRPRAMDLDAFITALEPFRRKVSIAPGQNVTNITISRDSGLLVVRDTAENLAQIRALIERLDHPGPQVMITCLVLMGTRADGDAHLPAELVSNLSRLVPYDHFELLTTGLISSSIKSGERISLAMVMDQGSAELSLIPGAYDSDTSTLSVNQCHFETDSGHEFLTRTSLRSGEYVVLGASGPEPLFAVLRMVAQDAPGGSGGHGR